MTVRKKLIEVALPLDKINEASAKEKAIRHGHPSTLHLWWARRPLATCRAVLFASLVDDPSSHPEHFRTPKDQDDERQRLFRVVERLVRWDSTSDEAVLEEARAEIRRSTGGAPPPVLDPFCGGGSIPLEAQRLGLEAHASDLNPVAVLITKALIEIPPRFADRPPVHLDARRGVGSTGAWKGAAGLAEDVKQYGAWMRDEAEQRIGHLYPKVHLPKDQGGGDATAIAWLWTRTITCPNPACSARMPLVRSFALSTRKAHEAWVQPVIDRAQRTIRFEVATGRGAPPQGTVNRLGARCIFCEAPVPFDHVRAEGRAGRMTTQLMAIVAEGRRGRIYLPPTAEQDRVAASAEPSWAPEEELPHNPRDFKTPNYGMRRFRDLFTPRQLVVLATLTDLVQEVRKRILRDALAAGLPDDGVPLTDGGTGARAYADAVATYLAEAASKVTVFHNTLAYWRSAEGKSSPGMGRQALPMTWDFAEVHPLAGAGGDWAGIATDAAPKVVAQLPTRVRGHASQADAASLPAASLIGHLISTDPPYYDNVGYADLSDFFYVWLRRSLGSIFPELFGTVLTPKSHELVATPYRFEGGKEEAKRHFERGLEAAFGHLRAVAHPDYPVTVYYAFKQAEADEDGLDFAGAVASTGWETMLEALIRAGFSVNGTWPMRTETTGALKATLNSLASSVVIVCRPRSASAPVGTRAEFAQALRGELPTAIATLQRESIAPVDLAQASIGPGMAVFTRYAYVLEADGSHMMVRTGLQLINAELDRVMREQEGELDRETRYCVAWFETHGFDEAQYGGAETLATAKDVPVQTLQDRGVLVSKGGKVQLRTPESYPADWDPRRDENLTIWRCTHQLVRALEDPRGGARGAGLLVASMGTGRADGAKELAYRLHGIAERKRWAVAQRYNQLVTDWPAIQEAAERIAASGSQADLGL